METNFAQPCFCRGIQRLGELPRPHGRRADVAHLARAHHIVQRFQRLLDRRRLVPAMDLVEIDVVRLQPAQALVQLEEDLLARKPAAVRPIAHHAVQLGRDHGVFALGVSLQQAPQHALAVAVRVYIRGIEEVDARVQRLAEKRRALLLVQAPGVPARPQRLPAGGVP